MTQAERLVLFDIDGTLLTTTRKAWESPFSDAIYEATGHRVDGSSYKAGGKTDPQIIHELMKGSGLGDEEVDAAIPAIRDGYLRRIRNALRGPGDVVLKPGAREAVEALAGTPGVALGLLTGNFEEGARIKLAVHDLNGYFPFGAFGDGARERSLLPPRAVATARARTGRLFTGKSVVLIGDTPNDVACGRPLGVRTVAVATGPFGLEALREAGPDFLFETLEDRERLLEAVLQDL
jgi:phosphoglycolate phosphatase-like HAD superfamily hydrolase